MFRRPSVLMALAAVLFVFGLALAATGAPKKNEGGRVITGEDLGIRVESRQGDVVLGTLMVRVDGEWIGVQILPTVSWAQP